MTKTMAEAKLRALISELVPPPPVAERLTVDDAGARLIAHLTTMRRKPSTTESYESYLRVHIAPYFDSRPIAKVTKEDVEGFVAACINGGQSVKSTLNVSACCTASSTCDQARMGEHQSGQARREAEEPGRGCGHPVLRSDGTRCSPPCPAMTWVRWSASCT